MDNLIGIVLPEDIKSKIVNFCTKYDSSRTEPCMSMISSDLLSDQKAIQRKLQSFCLSQPPFKTIIGGPNVEHSDSGSVLFLTVIMGQLNATRDALVKHLGVTPKSTFFRTQITLLEAPAGSDTDFNKLLAEAKEIFSKPTGISVKALAIYSRDDEDAPYTIKNSYLFTGR